MNGSVMLYFWSANICSMCDFFFGTLVDAASKRAAQIQARKEADEAKKQAASEAAEKKRIVAEGKWTSHVLSGNSFSSAKYAQIIDISSLVLVEAAAKREAAAEAQKQAAEQKRLQQEEKKQQFAEQKKLQAEKAANSRQTQQKKQQAEQAVSKASR